MYSIRDRYGSIEESFWVWVDSLSLLFKEGQYPVSTEQSFEPIFNLWHMFIHRQQI